MKVCKGKSHHKEFIILRNNSIQRRRFQNEQMYGSDEDDRSKLLIKEESEFRNNATNIPSYIGQSEALSYQMGRLEGKVSKLDGLHRKHLGRPTMDDDDNEAKEINESTKDVISLFSTCHQQLLRIQKGTRRKTGLEATFSGNLINSLGNRLQEATDNFRQSQNAYLKQIKEREKKSQRYFDTDLLDNGGDDEYTNQLDRAWTKQEKLILEDNTKFIQRREKEIESIVDSILELNSIFKDLVTMVSEQGTIVDRIDYNIENTSIKVENGLKQLKMAEKYQKSDKKMHCIVIMAVIVLFLLFILIIKLAI